MEDNVNFDNEILAYLTIRKVIASLYIRLKSYDVLFSIGSINREPQTLHLGAP